MKKLLLIVPILFAVMSTTPAFASGNITPSRGRTFIFSTAFDTNYNGGGHNSLVECFGYTTKCVNITTDTNHGAPYNYTNSTFTNYGKGHYTIFFVGLAGGYNYGANEPATLALLQANMAGGFDQVEFDYVDTPPPSLGNMFISSTTPILTGGVATLTASLGAFLPILLPVAIILGIFFGVFLYIKRAGRKH